MSASNFTQYDPNIHPPPPNYGLDYQFYAIYGNEYFAYWVPSKNDYHYEKMPLFTPPPQDFEHFTITPPPNTIDNLVCQNCSYGQIELILPNCRHPYHLACFNQYCITCDVEVKLGAFDLKDPSTCSICKTNDNLLKCQHCSKLYCFICIHLKTLEGCCQNLSNNLENESILCPGCEYTKPYSKFIPFKCKNHKMLCKKCLILGFSQKKCILGCDLSLNLNEFIKCIVCDKNEPAYLGEWRCPDGCAVCDTCQWVKNLIESEQSRFNCASCAVQLVN